MGEPRLWKQTTALVVILAFLCLFLPTSPAMAGWVPTRAAMEGPKARLISVLEREEIAQGLQQMGIDPAEAKRRIAGMTDAEAKLAVGKLDSLPAGGDGVAVVIGAVLFIFIVLLITDILGLTRVFPFVKKTVR